MHRANASDDGAVEPEPVAPALVTVLDPVVGARPALVAVDAGVLAPSAVAAVGLGELPPHPVTRTPITSAATASRRAGRERLSWFGWMPCCIWSPSCVLRVRTNRFYATRGFRTVSYLRPKRCVHNGQ
jgi:hypothetical protein